MVFENAKWIWKSADGYRNEYNEFKAKFSAQGKSVVRISVDGDYTLYINGKVVVFNQYGDYESYKIYDEIDITEFCSVGENSFELLCWYFGRDNQRYKKYQAGVIFEVESGNGIVLSSTKEILCKTSSAYKSGYEKLITVQLGDSFYYDNTKELFGDGAWQNAVEVNKNCVFYPRPNRKLMLGEYLDGKLIKSENGLLYDLSREVVGLVSLKITSEREQVITVAWGEHIVDGGVRRIINDRDFSFEIKLKKGANEFTNYMLRFGCRYLEIFADYPVTVESVGIIEQYYPVEVRKVQAKNPLDKRIYDICVSSLRLSMMEHYVDCPWREQALYNFDSRNQMLCGYYAFKGKNLDYVRSNLKLMQMDYRDDDMLNICFPCGADLTIPSFSLYWYLQLAEYFKESNDTAFAVEVYPHLNTIINAFIRNSQNGLSCKFTGNCNWNFYDWTDYLDGNLYGSDERVPDLITNCLFILALKKMKEIARYAGVEFTYQSVLDECEKQTRKAFFNKDTGLFRLDPVGEIYTVLGNSLAVYCGLTDDQEKEIICKKFYENDSLVDCSLSMKVFKYEVMLSATTDYSEWVLEQIRADYKKMIDAGATSTWETIDGDQAFNLAGSLCHGWTAVPIYFFHKLGVVKYEE